MPQPGTARHDAEVPGRDDPSRSSVGKALALLNEVLEEPTGVASLSDLSLRAGLPKSTVHRLMRELCEAGLVERAGLKYRPGCKLVELHTGVSSPAHRRLIDVATPALERLFGEVGNTVHLGILRGLDVAYLKKLSVPGASPIPSRVGGVLPASCTGIGKALLAAQGFADIVAAGQVRGPLPRMTPHSIGDPRRLAEQLRGAGPAGVMFDDGESRIGVRCVAAPVVVHRRPVAAISVSVIDPACEPQRFVGSIRDAARRIAAGLC